ncbi:hypothetical protein KJ590_00010 [Patescibacteria group bacterium]|nr:hypothetical protein [Patescibacteria group bacterium]
MTSIQKIAQLLRAPEEILVELFDKMEKLTGKIGVADKIFQENQAMITQKLGELGIPEDKADEAFVEAEILKKTKAADEAFSEFLGRPDFSSPAGCQVMVDLVRQVKNGPNKGFFIKEEKLKSFLYLNPPRNILSALGYKNIKEALAKEDLYELFAALRFVENERWLNEVFFRPYNDLIADNFEEREIKISVLSPKWGAIGQKFVGKKLHNISHLKEVGLVFLIPIKKVSSEAGAGQTLETFSLVLHYLHEVDFYCRLFRKYAVLPNFGSKLVKLVSGQVLTSLLPKEGINWRIIQRYLAKIDPQDPRLFEPHVNPETVHWLKAEKEMDELAVKNPQLKLDFWRGIDDFAGEIFPAGKRGEEIVSFDLLDNLISLTHGGLGKYLYHQQEALWNKIFIEFMGEEKLEEALVENIEKGFIEL